MPAEEIFWGVRKVFEAIARRQPLIVVIDDLHWAEPTMLDLIEHIADWSHDAPILLLAIARPEMLDARPQWGGGKMNATTILLEPLGAQESAELVGNLIGDEAAGPRHPGQDRGDRRGESAVRRGTRGDAGRRGRAPPRRWRRGASTPT